MKSLVESHYLANHISLFFMAKLGLHLGQLAPARLFQRLTHRVAYAELVQHWDGNHSVDLVIRRRAPWPSD